MAGIDSSLRMRALVVRRITLRSVIVAMPLAVTMAAEAAADCKQVVVTTILPAAKTRDIFVVRVAEAEDSALNVWEVATVTVPRVGAAIMERAGQLRF